MTPTWTLAPDGTVHSVRTGAAGYVATHCNLTITYRPIRRVVATCAACLEAREKERRTA